MTQPDDDRAARTGVSRRGLFGAGLAAAGAGAGAAVGIGGATAATGVNPFTAAANGDESIDLSQSHPFYATAARQPQGGVQTAPQRYCVFMTFDLSTSVATELQVLLARWSAAIAQLQAGKTVGSVEPAHGDGVGADTGEALDLGPASLTVTVGFGLGVFDERFGLADKRPADLADVPRLPSDNLQAGLTGGDLSLQACADDPQVAYHAVRDLARMARGTATVRWTVLGFGRASAGPHQTTPRNLMGFKDGTRNITTDEDHDRFVWVDDPGDGAEWMTGGTYQVVRKIRMNIEIWDADVVSDQQRVFGRTKIEGAPLSGGTEHTTPDFAATDGDGATKIDATSHIALAAHEANGGVKILRRPYNYTDGLNEYGQLDAGLLFLAYMNDPEHFTRLQRKLGASDRLNEYVSHIGSAVFAIPPAPRKGSYIGEQLFR
ncbi:MULTISPECIES: iron uptake transporter deferrochelatase/peroxidase subunit [unclassified Curtobacterium]|uniref:iron uptake transporter deferrochelatase/peroxidase subunit n=1 Tax=unclassified Curtobacterium TaxID=257496 RepID=UPI0010456A7C|nr:MULTISPECIES: iron uptake transporter deferrochelatase/peroxidase subunit [unclassified Curtobacterium]TCL78622.1 deferrochelatase/peroxidase EfeB [Curtobacterium sp. PhB128]TCL95383.1 deferrochelatase/peroxidase EfeB [Curtobacterium sp. PhB138]